MPDYFGVMLYTKSCKRELVDSLYDLRRSVSYDCVLEISTELGNKLCSLYHREKALYPPNLKCSLFTTAAVDNIDHNTISTSSHDAFHGTGISLFQHPDIDNSGVLRVVTATSDTVTSYAHLPENYTSIPAVAPTKTLLYLYKKEGPNTIECTLISDTMENEYR